MRALKLSQPPPQLLSRLLRLVRTTLVNCRRRRVTLLVWKVKRWIRQVRLGPDTTPLVSVIIPAHNAAATLAKTLGSLAVQRLGGWEAIIVDDGSTDATPEVVAAWKKRDSRIRHVTQAQSGVSSARNNGLLRARAERVLFLDADDWLADDYFEQMFGAIAENPQADVVYCGYVRITDDGWRHPMAFSWDVASAPFEAFGNHCAVSIHSVILRRQVVMQVGGFDVNLKTSEDWDLWLRVARTGAKFVAVPLPLAYYRMRPGSATSNYAQMIADAWQVIQRSRSADPRVRRPDPRYVDGIRDGASVERWTYFAIWCAACEAANGRLGAPALDLIGPLIDMKENADGISDCLLHGLAIGGRRPPWALAQIWRRAEPHLLEICQRLEAASTRPGLARCIMENLEVQIMRECDLASPQTLWRMQGCRIDVRGPVPKIEARVGIDNLYLRVTDGRTWLDEIYYPLLGPMEAREAARLIVKTWGFDRCLDRGPIAMRLHLVLDVAAEIARGFGTLFRSKHGRRRQVLSLISIVWRGLRCGRFLKAAGSQQSETTKELTTLDRALSIIEGHRNGSRTPMAAHRSDYEDLSKAAAPTRSTSRSAHWNQIFESADPWNYTSPYEQKKYDRTLEMLPDQPIARALELACAEGHFTERLAPRVGSLIGADISERALERARLRCRQHSNVEFLCLDLIESPIPGDMDLIVCSEVLYFLEDVDALRSIAHKLKSALAPGGRLVTAHASVLSDDPGQTGFDWSKPFGAKTIHDVFAAMPGLRKERSLITELYRIDAYRREVEDESGSESEFRQVPLESPLDVAVERQIVWGGAIVRRSDAIRTERTERVPILMYHRVSDTGAAELARYRITPRVFEQQLRFLRQHGYYTITADALRDAIRSGEALPGRPVMLTFDDAYRDFYETAWPLLQRYDLEAQVFVVTDKVSGCADWDSNYGEPAPLMSWEEIESLSAEGVSFGSHLATHRAADCLSTEELLSEGASSRFALEARLDSEIRSIAFPFGIHNYRTINTLKLAGYEIGLTTHDGVASIRMNPMALPRLEVMGSDDLAAFARKIGRYDAFRGTSE
jgi:peptidoglycan/xylan/chitin deacetylase (PgdA/CDA1 family)/SAM-dependent methyltransferase/GT2 family glycosyltransferase